MAASNALNAPLVVPLVGEGPALLATIHFHPQLYAADDPGTEITLLVDTGSDVTWVAKEGFSSMPKPPAINNPMDPKYGISTHRIPSGTSEDLKRWEAIYGNHGASGTTLTAMPLTLGSHTQSLAIGLADRVSMETRSKKSPENGILGLNLTSTVTGWPATKPPGMYKPLWLQLLDGTKLDKKYAISLDKTKGRVDKYAGVLEIGGPTDPRPLNAIAVPLVSHQDWCVNVQFYARVGGQDHILGGVTKVVLDTGADRVFLPEDIANAYNGHLNGLDPSAASKFVPQRMGLPPQAPVKADDSPEHDVALVVSFVDAKMKPEETKIAIAAEKLLVPDDNAIGVAHMGHGRVMGTAGMALLGMSFFLEVKKAVFDSGIVRMVGPEVVVWPW